MKLIIPLFIYVLFFSFSTNAFIFDESIVITATTSNNYTATYRIGTYRNAIDSFDAYDSLLLSPPSTELTIYSNVQDNLLLADVKNSLQYSVPKTWEFTIDIPDKNTEEINILFKKNLHNSTTAILYDVSTNSRIDLVTTDSYIIPNNFLASTKKFILTLNSTYCIEQWICEPWSPCTNFVQERKCNDIHDCKTMLKLPVTSIQCTNVQNITNIISNNGSNQEINVDQAVITTPQITTTSNVKKNNFYANPVVDGSRRNIAVLPLKNIQTNDSKENKSVNTNSDITNTIVMINQNGNEIDHSPLKINNITELKLEQERGNESSIEENNTTVSIIIRSLIIVCTLLIVILIILIGTAIAYRKKQNNMKIITRKIKKIKK